MGLQLQPTQGEIHVGFAVVGELHGGERRGQTGLSGLDNGVQPLLRFVLGVLSLGQ